MLLREPILNETPPGAVRLGTKGGTAPETIDGVLYSGSAEVMYRLPGGSGRAEVQFVAQLAVRSGWLLGSVQCQRKSSFFAITQSDSFYFHGWKSFGTWSTVMTVSSGSPVYKAPATGSSFAVPEQSAQLLDISIYVPPTSPATGVEPTPATTPPESTCLFSQS